MDFDVVICGAGVVGLAIAQELSKDYSCLVIDKEPGFGKATSSRNSEVIHAGLYYPPNSLKAKLCVEGNRLIYDWCDNYNVPYSKIGKYLTANTTEEESRLDEIYLNAKKSNTKGLRYADLHEMQEKEPYIKCTKAIFSKETGIIDSHYFMYSLEAAALSESCIFMYSHEMIDFASYPKELIIKIKDYSNNIYNINCRHFINSAGLYSDEIAKMTGLDTEEHNLNLEYWKGHYYKLNPSKSHYANHLIYPVRPKNLKGLGIHLTKDLNGYIKFGPDTVKDISKTEKYTLDYDLLQKFFSTISSYLIDIKENDLSFDQIGIRPKISTLYTENRDFYIYNSSNNNYNSIINLIGIESPGLTSSIAIAKYVKSMLDK